MIFSLTVLGSSSAIPTLTRNPSAHLLNVNERLFLIDCAEGTQLSLRRYHVHIQRLRHILISHLHGDHYFGLIGLITTLHLLGRREELHLFGPPPLEEILNLQLAASKTRLLYPMIFHPLEMEKYAKIFEDETVTIHSFPVVHSVPTCGFIFRERPRERKIRKDILKDMNIPLSAFPLLKRGEDFTDEKGIVHPNELLTTESPRPRSFAYCADTRYSDTYIPYIQHSDLLLHEATFMQDMQPVANEKWHSTAIEAATIAKKSHAGRLVINHYSARYDDLQPLLEEARSVFPNTELAEDGVEFKI